jgi:hypothetical protein
MIRVTETEIIIDRQKLFDWVTGEAQRRDAQVQDESISVPEDSGSVKPESEPQVSESVGTSEQVPTDSTSDGFDPDGVDLFEEKNGIGGFLQDAQDGRKKIDEVRDWLKKQKFSYNNFCLYLSQLKTVGGWPLKKPVIGNKKDGKPSIFYLALRYYSFWKSQQVDVAKEYKQFLFNQLRDRGLTIQAAVEMFEGEIIDPSELPKGVEVSV